VTFRLEMRWLAPSFFTYMIGLIICFNNAGILGTKQSKFAMCLSYFWLATGIVYNVLYALYMRPHIYFAGKLFNTTLIK
jgi:hypothetical protein